MSFQSSDTDASYTRFVKNVSNMCFSWGNMGRWRIPLCAWENFFPIQRVSWWEHQLLADSLWVGVMMEVKHCGIRRCYSRKSATDLLNSVKQIINSVSKLCVICRLYFLLTTRFYFENNLIELYKVSKLNKELGLIYFF